MLASFVSTAAAFMALIAIPLVHAQNSPEVIPLWSGLPPGAVAANKTEHELPLDPKSPDITRLTDVSEPTLSVYRPAPDKSNGCMVVICPGGGYSILAMKHEGTQVAEWLNGIGVTAAVLKYRCPSPPNQPRHLLPLQDAQRAVSILRKDAQKFGIDPERIGVLGFSAGGNLAAWSMCEGSRLSYDLKDEVSKTSSRPNFGILVYPAYLVGEKSPVPTIRDDEKPGEAFLVHANDDKLSAEGSVQYYLNLKKAGVPGELHVFADGGHGFGMLKNGKPVNDWPRQAGEWLESRQWLKGHSK